MLSIITNIFAASLRSGTPTLLAALGELIAEKSGVMNIGLEGMMLMGAISGFMIARVTGSPVLGLLAAILVGALISLLHAFLSITVEANQIISGLAVFFIGTGLSSVIGFNMVGLTTVGFPSINLGAISDIPVIGPVLFSQNALVYVAVLLVPITHIFLNKTSAGLAVRATGDNPTMVDAAGLSVKRIRYSCVMIGGAFSGFAGAYMSLAYTTMWQPAMTGGQGWIAVALVIFSQWNPFKAMGGAFLFGGITALQLAMQISGAKVSAHLLQMIPYLFTIIVLILAMWRARKRDDGQYGMSIGPASLGIPYSREN